MKILKLMFRKRIEIKENTIKIEVLILNKKNI